jgi:hypothetical protein
LTTQAHPTQSTYGCSTTTHCHTCQPEHYRRCRQTQYTHGARNRRTHRPVHNSAPDTAPRRHGYIHTRHIHKKGTPSRPQALYPSPRISRNGYKCQAEHAMRLCIPTASHAARYVACRGLRRLRATAAARADPCCTNTLTPSPGSALSKLAHMNCFHGCLCGCSKATATLACIAVMCAATSTCPIPPIFVGRLATAAAGLLTSTLSSSRLMHPSPRRKAVMRR